MSNIIEYTRMSHEELNKMCEERRNAFFEKYGTEAVEGESEEIAAFREWFKLDSVSGFTGHFRELYPEADEPVSEFTRRKDAAEYAKLIQVLTKLDSLDNKMSIERWEQLEACEKKIRDLEAKGEDTSSCYFAGAEYDAAIAKELEGKYHG